MSRKAKYSIEQKIEASNAYINGKRTAKEIADTLEMGKHGAKQVRVWASKYRENGIEGFHLIKGNSSYSAELKKQAVKEYINGKGSIPQICRKYKINSHTTLSAWIKKYNSNIELRDYFPKPEVYITMKRKTTKEERLEIVRYCLENGKNYKESAEKYRVSYSRVFSWVKKYIEKGEEGLLDKRGHRKKEEELSEIEILRRRVAQLEKEMIRKDMLVELLKKVKEFEGR